MSTPPSFELEFESKRPCLYARVRSKELTSGEAFRALGDILNEAAERHCRDVIVECDIDPVHRRHLHKAIASLADMRFPGKVAFVNCDGDADIPHELSSHVMLFESMDEAETWTKRPLEE